ncbi:uncharacterized protein [Lolium perenne]|uniref:uncharacterized protein n=1 Tax=Lolium perenne TaxID=4522 RepID=UPI003A99DEA2
MASYYDKDQSDQTRVFVTLWAIWHARRKAIHEQEYRSPLSVHLFVEKFIEDLNQSEEGRRRQPVVAHAAAPAWIPPPQGMLKINVDAGVGKNSGRGTVAAVARDSNGLFQGASAVVYPGRMDAETLEALACREAVSLALDVGARRVKVASDCSNVIASLEQGTFGVYAQIIKDINESRCSFDVLSFVHECRLSNKEAHRLAKSSVLLDQGRHVWLLEPPAGVCNLVTSEV